jgi:DNA-binding Xre family transcriptional regulator
MTTVHIKFQGRSDDLEADDLFPGQNLETLANISRSDLLEAVCNHLDIPPEELANYEVEFSSNGNATIHPQAEFGK